MLRAAYLGTNPAQATRDPATGQLRGPSYELAAELARRHGLALEFRAVNDPPSVIEEVRAGSADIGFVAFEATRLGTVEFSQPYMLVQQSFLVLDASPSRDIADTRCSGQDLDGWLSPALSNTDATQHVLADISPASAIPRGGLPRPGGPPQPRPIPRPTKMRSGRVGCGSEGG